MDKKRILIIGLEEQDVIAIKEKLDFDFLVIHYDMLPKIKLDYELRIQACFCGW